MRLKGNLKYNSSFLTFQHNCKGSMLPTGSEKKGRETHEVFSICLKLFSQPTAFIVLSH